HPSGRKQRTTTRRNQLGPTRPRRRIHHRHQKTTTRRHLGRNSNQTRNETIRNRTQRTDNGRQSHPRNPRHASTNHQRTTPKQPPQMTEQPKNDQLTTEWAKLARAEIDQTIPKATEYGQQSLINLGNQLAQLQGRQVTDPEAMELACWSYLNGKLQRFND